MIIIKNKEKLKEREKQAKMVYNDYELVSTKRVGNSRRKGMILGRRQYTAAGGNLTLFTTVMGGMAGNMLRVQKASYIPMS